MTSLSRCIARSLLWHTIPPILLANGCRLVMREELSSASDGWLTTHLVRDDPGAWDDISSGVQLLPRFFPQIWPFDVLVGCSALNYASDPDVSVHWGRQRLIIEHSPFTGWHEQTATCFDRPINLRERPADLQQHNRSPIANRP